MSFPTIIPDATRAREYFEDKMAFTTGPVELERELKTVSVIDVRAAEDYAQGHLPGAINLPQGTWERAEGLSRDKVNVVYCYSQVCHLAAKAAIIFTKQGFTVKELEGGFAGWKEHDLPVETGQPGQSRPSAKKAPGPRGPRPDVDEAQDPAARASAAERTPSQENL